MAQVRPLTSWGVTALILLIPAATANAQEGDNAMQLTSSVFEDGQEIPTRYTCEGEDVSPALRWSGAPDGTQSLALIVDDPDAPDPRAPKMTWVHWVVYNLPSDAGEVAEDVTSSGFPGEAKQGLNDWKRAEWGGPCPPIGRHRYFFKLYALDRILEGLDRPTKAALEEAMEGHILAQTRLVGTYEKKKE